MSKTQSHSTSLAAAFMTVPVKSSAAKAFLPHQEAASSKFLRHSSSQSDCGNNYNYNNQHHHQNDDCDNFSSCSSQGVTAYNNNQNQGTNATGITTTMPSLTQVIEGPTFVPVFSSVQAILPHHNNSAKGQVPWSCSNCNNTAAFGHKCQSCHKSRDTAALRVFMGQLTKEGDVQLIAKMLEVLCPELDKDELLHIEPHTHANTGRGKGCAWVYVSTLDQVLYLVRRLHKRTYPTVNAETGEVGFVAFPDATSNEEIKDAFDNDITFLGDHVVQLFHRSPITAEVPLSLQRVSQVNNSLHQQQQQQKRNQQLQQVQHHQQVAQNINNNNNNNNTNAVNTMKVVAYSAPATSSAAAAANTTKALPQQQQVTTTSPVVVPVEEINHKNENAPASATPFKRYRWNPYSSTQARVPLRG